MDLDENKLVRVVFGEGAGRIQKDRTGNFKVSEGEGVSLGDQYAADGSHLISDGEATSSLRICLIAVLMWGQHEGSAIIQIHNFYEPQFPYLHNGVLQLSHRVNGRNEMKKPAITFLYCSPSAMSSHCDLYTQDQAYLG